MKLYRKVFSDLEKWKISPNRKPILLRGARQVGKSYIAKEFSKKYPQRILLNLEKTEDHNLFERYNLQELIDFLFATNNFPKETETFFFIDEIQTSTKALQMLRFFYEEHPYLHVIAAGSLLDFALDKIQSFPVGRVHQIPIYPINFEEYLHAVNPSLLDYYHQVPSTFMAHDLLLPVFQEYTILGGMPEVLKTYLTTGDLVSTREIFADLWQSYKDDTEKYAKNISERKILRHILNYAHLEQDRIKFNGFANSNYKSREVSEAFQSLEMAKIIQLIYPLTQTVYPPLPNLKRSPRLQYLDTGLLNYLLGIQSELIGVRDLSDFMRGKIIQHIVSQELISVQTNFHFKPFFWVREQLSANAEIDIIYIDKNKVYPVEIKSGVKGRLRSLMQFMDESELDLGIRLSANYFSVEKVNTINQKPFKLLNIPYYHGTKISEYISTTN
jgi:hypothetical protein